MKNVVERIKTLLDERVRPLVADRGGDLAFQEFSDGVLRLAITGSPGATVPIKTNIANLVHHYIGEVDEVEFTVGAASTTRQVDGAPGPSSTAAVQRVLDESINPAVRAHDGFVRLVEVRNGEAFVRFEEGCQGCAMADVTLRQGVEVIIKEAVPAVFSVVDVTDHESGTTPYYKTKKT